MHTTLDYEFITTKLFFAPAPIPGVFNMESPDIFTCSYCHRRGFPSQAALRSHIRTSRCAKIREQMHRAQNPARGTLFAPAEALNSEPPGDDACLPAPDSPPCPPAKVVALRSLLEDIDNSEVAEIARQIEDDDWSIENAPEEGDSDDDTAPMPGTPVQDDTDSGDESDDSSIDSVPKSGGNAPEPSCEMTWIRDQFRDYCRQAQSFRPFTQEEVCAIRLLSTLKGKNTPMNAYESLMYWHLIETKKLHPWQKLGDYKPYISRESIIKKLTDRYNYGHLWPIQHLIELPVSGTRVRITCHNTLATIQRLLTDPRITPDDYLMFDNNPLAPPPENIEFVQDLNTGKAFLDTYARMINQEGREQLMPIVIYTDGTAISHFHNMELIQVNIALGNMTRLARMKSHCWAPLGYVEKIPEQGGRGRDILTQANHMETQDTFDFDTTEDANLVKMSGVGDKNDQDFHAMMKCILSGLVSLQDHGFIWDHHDAISGETVENIHYKIFIPYLKVDAKEADLCCGKYGQRSTTQQICRRCHIPLQEADDHLAKYPPKTVKQIRKLVEKGDLDALKALSQTYLENAFYDLRFSLGNDCGVHRYTPAEILHAFLLGLFKYSKEIFFELVGKSSELARQINAFSMVYSKFFRRQSDRTMPVAAFNRGIQVGKLMGKEYRGALLIILAILRSTKGRNMLKRSGNFKADASISDWIMLLETMLTWESYLNEPRMQLKHVKRLDRKHRYIMYLFRKVAQRQTGMGLKLLKFHSIIHLAEDILQNGVPLEYDTSPNEQMHKVPKFASKLTQRSAETFNYQTATRLVEFSLIDLAMLEIEHGKVPWNHFDRQGHHKSSEKDNNAADSVPEIVTGGAGISVRHSKKTGNPRFSLHSESKFRAQTHLNTSVLEFLLDLQDKIGTKLQICTCHKRDGQTFRGHPNYLGKGPWRDWVMVNWGPAYGKLPAHIWCFVVLPSGLPEGRNKLSHGGIDLKKGVFAVVETATKDTSDDTKSDLFTPYLKDVEITNGIVGERHFFLADTEAFDSPCCMIPDIGGPCNRYFLVTSRSEWANEFVKWVEDAHEKDKMDVIPVPAEETVELSGKEDENSVEAQSDSGDDAEEDQSVAPKKRKKRRRKGL